jgi:type IV secretion system protein VirB1
MDLAALVVACAPLIAPDTAQALIAVESGANPFAIGVIGSSLQRQPRNAAEAEATAQALDAAGWNYDLGIAQINKKNLTRYGLNLHTAFEPCRNVKAMQAILGDCYARASKKSSEQYALRQAFSCYQSGNFQTGFQQGYVGRVVGAWRRQGVLVQQNKEVAHK